MSNNNTNHQPSPQHRLYLQLCYCGLTACTSFLELGVVIFGLAKYGGLTRPLLFVAAFRLAHVLTSRIMFSNPRVAATLILFGTVLCFMPRYEVAAISIGVFIIEVGLHSLRESLKDMVGNAKRVLKDVTRSIGFIVAPGFTPGLLLLITTGLGVGLWPLGRKRAPANRIFFCRKPGVGNKLVLPEYIFVAIHNVHFFIYAFWLVAAFCRGSAVASSWSGAVFLLGWIGYYCVDQLVSCQRWVAVTGHLGCMICLVALSVTSDWRLVLLLWFCTGVGGGTIFIRRAFHRRPGYDEVQSELYEGVGQVVGVIISATFAFMSVRQGIVYFSAGIVALFTAITALFVTDERGEPAVFYDLKRRLTKVAIN